MNPPWRHQAVDLELSWDLPAAAFHWEPRLGKSRVAIETARRLRDAGRIDAVVLVAPNGVHLNWSRDQLPRFWGDPAVLEWRSSRVGTKSFERELEASLADPRTVWACCNVEAVATPKLQRFLQKFVKRRRCLLVVDESHYVKNGRAQRTRALLRLAEGCPYRRTLTGTPTPQGPFDLWSQFHLLDPAILGSRFVPFKQRYGVWRRTRYGSGPFFDQLVEYRNLDDLRRRIAPYTFERKKADCFDLPERLFSRRYFELPPGHARIYRQLRDDLLTRLDSGEEVLAPEALTNLLRLQQVTRGHVEGTTLPAPYPSLETLRDLLASHEGKAVVWCRFVRDAEMVAQVAGDVAGSPVGGDAVALCVGGTPPARRVELRVEFNDPASPRRFWVGTVGTGGVGVDLGAASLMIFYSHGYDLAQRLQALERNYGSSQRANRIDVVDLVAADTVDERVLAVLERKESLAASLSVAGLRGLLR